MATVGKGRAASAFIADRVWRIFPMWLVAVAPWLIARHLGSGTVLTSLTLWPIWGGVFHWPALRVGWTLCFEMLFYGGFALALATRPYVPLIIFAVCFVVSSTGVWPAYLGSPMIFEFLAGVVIARLPASRYAILALVIGLLWLAFAPVGYSAEAFRVSGAMRVLSWGVPAVLIVYGAVSLEPVFKRRAFDPVVLLGDASYSVYLFHRLITIHESPWPISMLASLAVGMLIYWAVERPIISLRRLAKRGDAPALATRIRA